MYNVYDLQLLQQSDGTKDTCSHGEVAGEVSVGSTGEGSDGSGGGLDLTVGDLSDSWAGGSLDLAVGDLGDGWGSSGGLDLTV